MYIVSLTDTTHELRIYNYECKTLEEAEKFFNNQQFNALLLEINNGIETIIKSK